MLGSQLERGCEEALGNGKSVDNVRENGPLRPFTYGENGNTQFLSLGGFVYSTHEWSTASVRYLSFALNRRGIEIDIGCTHAQLTRRVLPALQGH